MSDDDIKKGFDALLDDLPDDISFLAAEKNNLSLRVGIDKQTQTIFLQATQTMGPEGALMLAKMYEKMAHAADDDETFVRTARQLREAAALLQTEHGRH